MVKPGSAADPYWYKDAVIYELHVKAFFDANDDGIGDFRGLIAEARLPPGSGRHLHLAPAVLSRRPLRDDGYDIADYTGVHPPTARCEDFKRVPRRGPRPRPAGASPSWSSTTPPTSTPGSRPRGGRRRARPSATSTSGATRDQKYPDVPDHLHRHRDVELDLGPGGQGRTTGTGSSPTSPTSTSTTRQCSRRCFEVMRFWLDMGVDGAAARRHPLPVRARGDQLREPARDPRRSSSSIRAALDAAVPRPDAPGRGQPVARGRAARTSATATSATWPSTSR